MQLDHLFLNTGRLELRHFCQADTEACFDWLSDEQTCLDLGGYHAFTGMDAEYECMMRWYAREAGRYMLVRVGDERVIGTCAVTMSDERAVPAVMLECVIAPPFRRRGYAAEAIRGLCNACFDAGAELVLARACTFNRPALRLMDALGFAREGVCRKEANHAIYGFVDMIHFVLEKK